MANVLRAVPMTLQPAQQVASRRPRPSWLFWKDARSAQPGRQKADSAIPAQGAEESFRSTLWSWDLKAAPKWLRLRTLSHHPAWKHPRPVLAEQPPAAPSDQ